MSAVEKEDSEKYNLIKIKAASSNRGGQFFVIQFELSLVVADKMIPTQFLRVPARIFTSLKTGLFYVALHLPCTTLQNSDRQQKVGKVRFSHKWGRKVEILAI